MKLARYGKQGSEKPAIVDAQGQLRDISHLTTDINPVLLADMSVLQNIDTNTLPLVEEYQRIGACVGNSGKLIGIGLNYSDHAAETGATIPSEPIVFMKATSSIIGAYDSVVLPRGSKKTDWEVELGFVIGKTAKYVSEADALQYIAGYCVVNDVSERDFQTKRQGQWTKGKSCDTFAPVGPYLVTADEIPTPQNLSMWLDVNGERKQTGSTDTMIYSVAFLVSYLSQFMTLHIGDIITTGTPPGVGMGMNPPQFLKAGDIMELGIQGLGTQKLNVLAD